MDLYTALDGFWLPASVRARVITSQTEYTGLSFANGRPCQPGDPGAVTVRWPVLSQEQWGELLGQLEENRQRVPCGAAFWKQMGAALHVMAQRFADSNDPLRALALNALPGYTGYSEAMIRFTLGAMDMMSLGQFPAAFAFSPVQRAILAWQPMPGLPGRLRFYPAGAWRSGLARLPGFQDRPLFGAPAAVDLVLGYGAGNVPGTSLLIAFLAQAITLAGGALPAVVVKNSRREPIFTPLVLSALEAIDPDLVATAAVLVWDYEDRALGTFLLGQASLVIAAASDETITQLQGQIRQTASPSQPVRFHAHGHKVSFSAIGAEMLAHGLVDSASGQALLDIIALLAALDSAFWDQHGCLSSRIHFVENAGKGCYTLLEYAAHLNAQLQMLARLLPRGAWPRQQLHDRFDRYKQLETTGLVQVLSRYQDDFLVIVDQRLLKPQALYSMVNDCQGRVVIVRPVASLMEIPNRYLCMLPAANLQSLSVALGRPGEGLTGRILRFAEACGKRGVTALRTVGRGAFPQLSHSWDGLIPMDLVCLRPAGYFTTLEFEQPFEQILETFHFMARGQQVGSVLQSDSPHHVQRENTEGF